MKTREKSGQKMRSINIRVDDETEQQMIVIANEYGMVKASLTQYLIARFIDAHNKTNLAFPIQFKTMQDVIAERAGK